MPMVLDSGRMAQLRSLASRNEQWAQALVAFLDTTYYVALSAGAEAANVIRITGQVTDQDGQSVAGVKNVLVTSVPVSGAGTMAAVSAHGTVKAGAASKQVWVQTLSNGSFQLDVTNAAAEDNLITAQLDNGTVETLVLTYA